MTKEVFESYVEHFLAPALLPGQVVVMDNLSAHKGERVRVLIEQRGCEILYLPSYSPDFNPIEKAFNVYRAKHNGVELADGRRGWVEGGRLQELSIAEGSFSISR